MGSRLLRSSGCGFGDGVGFLCGVVALGGDLVGFAVGGDLDVAVEAGDVGFGAEGLEVFGAADATCVAGEDAGDGDFGVGGCAEFLGDGMDAVAGGYQNVAFEL